MDILVRFSGRLTRKLGYIAVISLFLGLFASFWWIYDRNALLTYGTDLDGWEYLDFWGSDVQQRVRFKRNEGFVAYRRVIDSNQIVLALFDQGRFFVAFWWKSDCELGEALELPTPFDPLGKDTQTLKCEKFGGSTWYRHARLLPRPMSYRVDIGGFQTDEDFNHPRWGGFVEGRRLDAINTARQASAD